MRTQAVPADDRTNGSTRALRRRSDEAGQGARRQTRSPSCAVMPDPLAEDARRPEHQYQDQHDEGEHVAVVAPERTSRRRAQRFADGEPGVPSASTRPDEAGCRPAPRRRGCRCRPAPPRRRPSSEQFAHGVVRLSVVGADHHASHRRQRGADHEGEGDDARSMSMPIRPAMSWLRGGAHGDAQAGAVNQPDERPSEPRSDDGDLMFDDGAADLEAHGS